MLSRIMKRPNMPIWHQIIRWESISVGSVRAGMILKLDDSYVEVKKYEHKREGRGGAMGAIEFVDLVSSKIGRVKLGVQQRVDKPDLTKLRLTVQFVDSARGVVVAADDDYEQQEFPIKLVAGAEGFLEAGTVIGLAKDGDVPIKASLPPNILALIKKQ